MGLIRVRLLYHTELLTAISEKLDTRGPEAAQLAVEAVRDFTRIYELFF